MTKKSKLFTTGLCILIPLLILGGFFLYWVISIKLNENRVKKEAEQALSTAQNLMAEADGIQCTEYRYISEYSATLCYLYNGIIHEVIQSADNIVTAESWTYLENDNAYAIQYADGKYIKNDIERSAYENKLYKFTATCDYGYITHYIDDGGYIKISESDGLTFVTLYVLHNNADDTNTGTRWRNWAFSEGKLRIITDYSIPGTHQYQYFYNEPTPITLPYID